MNRLLLLVSFVLALSMLILFVGLPMLFLGPDLHFSKKGRLLSALTLADGSRLFLAQRPNSTLSEPYTVELYRLYTNRLAESCLIGFEEPYWWRTGLRQKDAQTIEVVEDGTVRCTYNPKSGIRTWVNGRYPPLGSRISDYQLVSNRLWSIKREFMLTK